MAFWARHKLAEGDISDLKLKVRSKVRSTVALPGVPLGMKGRVLLANGFVWPRYNVEFENGLSVSNLDGRQLERA